MNKLAEGKIYSLNKRVSGGNPFYFENCIKGRKFDDGIAKIFTKMTDKNCFNCGNQGSEFFGYFICENCKAKLKLFSGKTIKRYLEIDPIGFPKEIERRLDALENDYIKKRIKLLHILNSIH